MIPAAAKSKPVQRALFWTLLFLTMVNSPCPAAQNILLIIADDYGIDSSSLYNSNADASLPPTPNIVSLAQSGVLFRNAYANPVCSPTRACIITGRHGFRTGVGDAIVGATSGVLTGSEFTLPEAFAANPLLGYQLAQFGKWHLSNGANSPNNIGGWPYYAGNLMGALADYTNWTKIVNGVATANYTNYATTDVVNDAISWIQARGTNAWFAWVAFNAAHTPLHKPPSNLCPHYATLPGTQADINLRSRLYFEAMVEAMDTEMGRLLAVVNRTNTHIIFLGDNGTSGQVIQSPYKRLKAKDTLYEGGVRVPFVVAGPAVSNPGRTNETLVHAVDIFSTILEMAGINRTTTISTNIVIDSKSIFPLLQSTNNLDRHAYVEKFGPNTAATDGRALRNAQFKLIQYTNGTEELYDLVADPYEDTNLLAGSLTATQEANYYALLLRLAGYSTLSPPRVTGVSKTDYIFSATVPRGTNFFYSLWRSPTMEELAWRPVTNAVVVTNGLSTVTISDTNASSGRNFYRVVADVP